MALGKRKPLGAKKKSGLFKGIKDAPVGNNRIENKPGTYTVAIQHVGTDTTRDHKPFVRVDCIVVHGVDVDGIGIGEKGYMGHPQGYDCSTCMFAGDYFLSEMKRFISVAFNMDADDVEESDAYTVCGLDEDEQELTDEDGNAVQPCFSMCLEVAIEHVMMKPEKAEEAKAKGKDTFYKNVRFVRSLDQGEVEELLSEEKVAKYFPNGVNYVSPEEAEDE